MSRKKVILVLGDDRSSSHTKTSRQIGLAAARIGRRAIVRDTSLLHWSINEVPVEYPERREAFRQLFENKWNKLILDYGVDTVIGLDLCWLLSPDLFLRSEHIQCVHSFWICKESTSLFPSENKGIVDIRNILNDNKCVHHCFDGETFELLKTMGIERVIQIRSEFWEQRLEEALHR